MGTWILMFVSCLLVPGILMAFGSALKISAPGQINSLFGYRTTLSMKNPQTWEFANRLWGRLAFRSGIWMLIGTVIVMAVLFFAGEETVEIAGTVLMLAQVAVILGTIPVVEHALRKEFDKDGNRRA